MISARKLVKALAVPLLVLGMGSAQALALEGDTVIFDWAGDLDGLFGTASVSGDTLRFAPTTFFVSGSDTLSATTPLITVRAKPTFVLEGASLFEQGIYFRMEAASGGATTVVGAGGQFIVNGSANAFSAGSLNAFQTPEDVIRDGILNNDWTASAAVSVSGEEATLELENILLAGITSGLEAAFIEKTLVEIRMDTVVIPIPATVWLVGSALLGLAVIGRRRPVV